MSWAETDDDYEEATFAGAKTNPSRRTSKKWPCRIKRRVLQPNSLQLYPDEVYEGARVLNMDVKFVAACYEAVHLVYNRRYTEAKAAFEKAQQRYP